MSFNNIIVDGFGSAVGGFIKDYISDQNLRFNLIRSVALLRVTDPDLKILNFGCGRTNFGTTNCDVVEQDAENFELISETPPYEQFGDKEFDLTLLIHVLEHVPDPVEVLKEIDRISKNRVILVPSPDSVFYRAAHHRWLFLSLNPPKYKKNQAYVSQKPLPGFEFMQEIYKQTFEKAVREYGKILTDLHGKEMYGSEDLRQGVY
jgi:ubiquinone/menaquinone biosynthesis C-methylase UbiE